MMSHMTNSKKVNYYSFIRET